MLEELKKQVCEANLELVARGVVIYTWGNASGIDRDRGLVIIKPSGVAYDNMTPKAEMKQYILDKHYMRKHGPNAYYGQEKAK